MIMESQNEIIQFSSSVISIATKTLVSLFPQEVFSFFFKYYQTGTPIAEAAKSHLKGPGDREVFHQEVKYPAHAHRRPSAEIRIGFEHCPSVCCPEKKLILLNAIFSRSKTTGPPSQYRHFQRHFQGKDKNQFSAISRSISSTEFAVLDSCFIWIARWTWYHM